jgi:hypothetical protein
MDELFEAKDIAGWKAENAGKRSNEDRGCCIGDRERGQGRSSSWQWKPSSCMLKDELVLKRKKSTRACSMLPRFLLSIPHTILSLKNYINDSKHSNGIYFARKLRRQNYPRIHFLVNVATMSKLHLYRPILWEDEDVFPSRCPGTWRGV